MSKPHSKHLPYLDGWRGLAICFLLVGHFFPIPGINLGAAGVNLFFVLSGFLMARLLFVDAVPIPTFYKRRAARIFPAVFCFMAVVIALYLALGKPLSWTEIAAAAAFLINYFPGQPGAAVMPFGHIWSLCVEEHSYILLSIVAVAVRARWLSAQRAVGLLAGLSAVIGFAYWLTYRGQHLALDRWIHSEVSAFGIFASALILLLARGRKMPRLALPVLPVLIGFGFALHWWSVPAPVRLVFGVGAFALAVNLLEGAPRLIHDVLSFRPLRQLGLWSFSIYLWQQPFYLYAAREGLSPFIGVGLAVIAGIASFYMLENPARIYLNRKWTQQRASVAQLRRCANCSGELALSSGKSLCRACG
jgi:peptidoglycan/LPS O-acetylase OafA/YrhL